MAAETDVAIIGAGPYGLSIAAHLSAHGVPTRIFGKPMQTWREAMPPGMKLKSEGFASNLYDPASAFPLSTFCAERRLPYAPIGVPTPVETFVAYGTAFQQRFVPDLEDRQVTGLDREGRLFRLGLDSGETVLARHVVVAAGLRYFAHTPAELASLPDAVRSHCSAYGSVTHLRGRRVIVVGAGASALDTAAALVREGADVSLVSRRATVPFHNPPVLDRPLKERLTQPWTGIGLGWRSVLCTRAPLLFHAMPEALRLEIVRKHLPTAPGWFVRQEVEGRVTFHLGATIAAASTDAEAGIVTLRLTGSEGTETDITADHVIAGTGYKVDVDRYDFLGAELRSRIRRAGRAPALSRHFESSVPGLYFAGTAAANSFGPLLRFAYGAGFAARQIANHLARRVPSKVSEARRAPNPATAPAVRQRTRAADPA